MYYLLTIVAIVIHWQFLKQECILSYFEHLRDNPNYKLGDNPTKQESYEIIGRPFGMNEKNTRKLFQVFVCTSILFSILFICYKR